MPWCVLPAPRRLEALQVEIQRREEAVAADRRDAEAGVLAREREQAERNVREVEERVAEAVARVEREGRAVEAGREALQSLEEALHAQEHRVQVRIR